ncbi:MAG: DUF6346 domain-containing protein [Umezawaea sp.]
MRLRRAFVLIVMPVVGYFLGATILFALYDRVEPATEEPNNVLVVTSCDRNGPVTYKGFGYWYTCHGTLTNTTSFKSQPWTVGFLRPDQIGQRFSSGYRGRHHTIGANRPYGPVSVVLCVVFGLFWVSLMVRLAPGYHRRKREMDAEVEARRVARKEAEDRT